MFREVVNEQVRKRNHVQFAFDNKDIVAFLNRETTAAKFIHIFDIRRERFVRKISKKRMEDEAFAIDITAKLLAYVEGETIFIKLIRIPNSPELADVLRPRFNMARMKLNPVTASENKQVFKDKLYNMLHAYHFFKDYPDRAERETGMTEEQNIQLMVLKYQESVNHPFKMKANRELMMLMKVLLRD